MLEVKVMADVGRFSLVDLFLGITVAVIVGVGVAIPIVEQVIANASLSGTTLLLAGFISLFIVLLIVVALARAMSFI